MPERWINFLQKEEVTNMAASPTASQPVIRMTLSVAEEGDVHLSNGSLMDQVLSDYFESHFLI
jgi:hypothetical protein